MNAVDLIAHKATDLPEALQAEVLDFIGYLKTRHPTPPAAVPRDAKLAELTAFFAPYQKDFGTFVFDREEANAQ
jgi:hypothetical protein